MKLDVDGVSQMLRIIEEDTTTDLASIVDELMALSMALAKTSSRTRQLVNRQSSIHRLPLEILSHIFALVPKGYASQAHRDLAHIFGPFAIGPPSDLLPLMAVCHRWRDILVSCAKLWAVVDDRVPITSQKPATYAPYLHRNPTGPLFVYMSTPRPCPGTYALLRESGTRVQELRVSQIDEQQLEHIAAFSADNLLACSLSDIMPPYSLRAPTLFKGRAPQLRALHLNSVLFLPCNNFQALAHLMITFPTGGRYNSPRFKFPHLLASLRGSPALETAYFRDVGTQVISSTPAGAAYDPPDNSLAVLLCLRRLSIMHTTPTDSSVRFQSEIFTHLRLPPSCLIYVSPTKPSSLPPLVTAIHAASPSRQLSSMALFDGGQMADGDSSHLLLVDDQRCHGVRVDVSCTLEAQTYRYPPEGHEHVCRALSSELFVGIKALHVTSTSFVVLMRPPCNLFRTLLLLERLVLTSIMDTRVFAIRSESTKDTQTAITLLAPQDDAQVPFPNLTGLGLPELPVSEMTVVRDLLKSRRDAGNPLRNLAVALHRDPAANRELDPQVIEELTALVETLTNSMTAAVTAHLCRRLVDGRLLRTAH
ncbi:hypothetical protein C8Q80DRAFT_1266984 [Daedaleopsis nitida]|nr:hypothetical protein C8Q80DRAFT_1266984 [Daedaleopsis nitida]